MNPLACLRYLALAVGAVAALPVLANCRLPDTALRAGPVQAVWQPIPAPIKNGKLFALEVQLCPSDAQLLKVDATMPEHQHGMNYRPTVTRMANGNWRAEGLVFHMPGKWALRLDVQSAGGKHILHDTITLP